MFKIKNQIRSLYASSILGNLSLTGAWVAILASRGFSLVEIGLGKLKPDAFRRAFESGSRLDLGMTAPPSGLELTEVRYPALAFTDPDTLRWHEEE